MGFAGIPRETVAFLQGLEANNDRVWFEAHRAEYEAFWLKVGLDLAADLSGSSVLRDLAERHGFAVQRPCVKKGGTAVMAER